MNLVHNITARDMKNHLESVLKAYNEDGYKLVSTVPLTMAGSTQSFYLFFEKV